METMGILDKIKGFTRLGAQGEKQEKQLEDSLPKTPEGYMINIRLPIMPYREKPKGEIVERYTIYDPWAMVSIILSDSTSEYVYFIDETPLTEEEIKIYRKVIDFLIWEVGEMGKDEDPKEFIVREARRAIDLFKARAKRDYNISWDKILYYVEREVKGFGPINVLMLDPNLEDISCNGVGLPIYVYHRKYESMPTNIIFQNDEDLSSFVVRLAHMAGKHISVAYPVLDASLPGGHRLAATFAKEISQKGSAFTIRKFREDPLTVVDMISLGTISPELAAYLWFLIEHKKTFLIMGVTGSGKTTLLNAILNLVRPNYKIVTIEETPEIRLPIKNWVQLVTRSSYAGGESKTGEITLYDLVKISLRYRPDLIVVGEVRGSEAYVLFQAIATGHGGATTIHAESIDAAIKRLTSPPMNIPESYIPLINSALMIERVPVRSKDGTTKISRRVTKIWEIDKSVTPMIIGKWSPSRDMHLLTLDKSPMLNSIAEALEISMSEILDEIRARAGFMRWLYYNNIRNYIDIASAIYKYYRSPKEILSLVEADLGHMGESI